MEKLPYTKEIKRLYDIWEILESNLAKVLNQGLFQKKISITEKIFYLKEISSANVSYWEAVNKEYPQTVGRDASGNYCEITLK